MREENERKPFFFGGIKSINRYHWIDAATEERTQTEKLIII